MTPRSTALRALMTAAAMLMAAPVLAAPAAQAACTQGQGKQVCCKAYVADHCSRPTCCESGNLAFFTTKRCGNCASRTVQAVATASSCGVAAATSACGASGVKATVAQVGTLSFFSRGACGVKTTACSQAAAAAACGDAAVACGTVRAAAAPKSACCGSK